MKISLIIPVYNEADGLNACLQAIARLKPKPFEVIVVDNNSTDATAAIAASYDFVTLAHEPRQGVVHARTLGFNLARGDVIARIDGDSLLPSDWIKRVEEVMSDNKLDAVSGVALYYNVAASSLINWIDLVCRRWLSANMSKRMYLWGANMAIRREAWERVKSSLCSCSGLHEDYDIAIHLQAQGGVVTFDERLRALVSSRRIDTNFIDFMHYVWVSPLTYARHGLRVKRYLYPIVALCAVGYLPAWLLHKGYDPVLERFSWSRLVSSASRLSRVDPTTNVA